MADDPTLGPEDATFFLVIYIMNRQEDRPHESGSRDLRDDVHEGKYIDWTYTSG